MTYHFIQYELDVLKLVTRTTVLHEQQQDWGDDLEIMLPGEPPREGYVVEAVNDRGGMEAAYRPLGDHYWLERNGGPRLTWDLVVGQALHKGWKLFIRKQAAPVRVGPHLGPYEDDGEQD